MGESIKSKYKPSFPKKYKGNEDTITDDEKLLNTITGISISSKIANCVIKIWNNTSNLKEVNILNINNYDKMKCIYKAHNDR